MEMAVPDTLLAIARRACLLNGVPQPREVARSKERVAQSCLAAAQLALEHVRQAAVDNGGWAVQQTSAAVQTVAGTAIYDLPADYQGLIPGAQHEDGCPCWLGAPLRPIERADIEMNGLAHAHLRFHVTGGKIHFTPVPTGETVTIHYMSRGVIYTKEPGWDLAAWDSGPWDGAQYWDEWRTDDDVPRLDAQLLRSGTAWYLSDLLKEPNPVLFDRFESLIETALYQDGGGPPHHVQIVQEHDGNDYWLTQTNPPRAILRRPW